MVDHLFSSIPQKCGRKAGAANRTKNNHTCLQMLCKVRNDFFRQAFFHVRIFFIKLEFLSQRFHRDQMLTADGVVIYAWVEVRQFNSNIDWRNRIGADQIDFCWKG
ncbi:hypothetical protein SRABI106_04250 [Rahnella aquatilis]|nr:hypothetical protein SRABI106_04250 [Rahnella aquatilis]